jgi:hypothetical protein
MLRFLEFGRSNGALAFNADFSAMPKGVKLYKFVEHMSIGPESHSFM